jgi:hypothetical protein
MDQVWTFLKEEGQEEKQQNEKDGGKALHLPEQAGQSLSGSLPFFEENPRENEKGKERNDLPSLLSQHEPNEKGKKGCFHNQQQNCTPELPVLHFLPYSLHFFVDLFAQDSRGPEDEEENNH